MTQPAPAPGVFAVIVMTTLLIATALATDAYELRPPSNPVLNSADRDLKSIRSWHNVAAADDQVTDGNWIAQKDFPIQIVSDPRAPYEMLITELRSGPWADQEHWTDGFLNADNIRTWQNSTPEGKIFLAYIAAGSLTKTKYFNGVPMSARSSWTDASGTPTANAPIWLLCADQTYAGLNWVAFWYPAWKQHLLTEVEYAITIGANGVYLDEFDAIVGRLNRDPACAGGKAAGVDLELEMLRLVQEIRAYVQSRALGRPFPIVVFDGRDIHSKYPDVVRHIDGSVGEHLFFVGWNLSDFLNGPEETWRTQQSIAYINVLAAAGVPMFGLEYVTDPAKISRLAVIASTVRFTPAVSEQKILVVSRPRNVLWCDKTQCSNNGSPLASRHLTVPIEETFFELLEGRFPEYFRPAWRITQQATSGDTYVYRHYRDTGTYVGYRTHDRAGFYFDSASGTFLVHGTVESVVSALSAP
jgi:uncharacterized protein (TIGR01370 family)